MRDMPRRILGRTGLEVSVIGLGTEYLRDDPKTAIATIHQALDRGVNFFDVLMPMPDYRDSMGAAFAGRREQAILTCHLGGVVERGQWGLSRDPAVCLEYFEDWLRRLGTDYVDVLNITCVDKWEDYETILRPGGVMELAQRLVTQGKVRHLGISGHELEVALPAVTNGLFDVVIHGCNLNWPLGKLGPACVEHDLGLVAMKPYAGGEFFHPPYSEFTTPALALAYVLAQPGVATVIPGAANPNQLEAALSYLTATEEQRDFTRITANFAQRIQGTCTYCNHCLPCSAGIPIGDVMRAYRGLSWGSSYAEETAGDLADQPERCLACGECEERCPFGVAVIATMTLAASSFAPYRQA